MAAIRSHFISLFSGGIFPDRKWWLSCFCLPHSKEDKRPTRQPPPAESAIYTIQTDDDEEPKTEFRLFSGLEETSVHEEALHGSGAAMVSEAPLANGFKVHLLNSLSLNNHPKNGAVSVTEEHEVKANAVDVVDVAFLSVSENVLTETEESSFISSEASLSIYDAVNACENKEPLADISLNATSNDRDKVVADMCAGTEGLAGEQPLTSCGPPFLADLEESQLSLRRKIQAMNTTNESRESGIETANEALSENTDDVNDGLKSSADLASTCSSDQSFNLETSGIQSNLSSFEDTFVPLSTYSENGMRMQTSDEDSEHCFRFESFHATSSSSAESTSHEGALRFKRLDEFQTPSTTIDSPYSSFHSENLYSSHPRLTSTEWLQKPLNNCGTHLIRTPIDSNHIEETPAMSTSDDRQEMKKSTSASSQLLEMALSANMEKHFHEGDCLELCNGMSEQETVLVDNQTCGAVTLGDNFDQQRFAFEVGRAESDALFNSKCDVTETCAVSDQLLQHRMQSIMDTCPVVPDGQYSNQAAKTEFETTFTGIAQSTGNAESTVNEPDGLRADYKEMLMAECLDGNDYAAVGSNCEVKDEEIDAAFDESMRLNSLLQMKLLFRPDSYETFERLVDGETVFLLRKALDEVFTVRRNREALRSHGRKGLSDFHREVNVDDEMKRENGMMMHCDELSSVGHQDPFNLPKSNVFQEIVIENFEQLFDNEEWLDDDFGFSSAIKSEFQQPPYCDRIIGQQDYSREAFRLRDFELEDDFPDSQLPVIQLMPETLFPLVDQATDIFWSRRRYGEPVSAVCPPETYFSVKGHSDNVDNCSQRSHESFVFHLVAEMLQEIYSDELTEVPEPWQKVYNFKPKFTENPPTTVDVLKPLLHNRVLQWLKFEKGFPHEMTKKGIGLKKQLDKKDMVDRMLITEMYQEEPNWTDYSQDANMIKNRVANKLFSSLIEDTVQTLKFIQSNALTNNANDCC